MTTRPDPRLLLPASAVDREPEGVRVWVDGCDYPCVIVNGERALPGGGFLIHPLKAYSLDLSAPVGGERLDAREWGLRQLHPEAVSIQYNGNYFAVWGCGPFALLRIFERPDLSGLAPDDAARAVLVAALVARANTGGGA